MSLARPYMLLFLILLAPMGLAMLLTRARARKAMERLADPGFESCVVKGPAWLFRLRSGARLGAVAVLILAAAGPTAGGRAPVEFKPGDGVWILLDVSRSMGVADVPRARDKIHRLEAAGEIIRLIVEHSEPRPVALITFSGPAYLRMPLTVDYNAFLEMTDRLDTGEVFGGTDLAAAARELVSAARRAGRGGRIVLISDGENTRGKSPIHAYREALDNGFITDAVGLGTAEGGHVPISTAYPGPAHLRDAEGRLILSRRNESLLQSIARAGGGQYVDGNDLDELGPLLERLDADAPEVEADPRARLRLGRGVELLQVLLVMGIGLAALEAVGWWVL